MSIEKWLRQADAQLKAAGISTARLDCLVLLEDETGKDRSWLLAHPDYELQRSEIESLSTKIAQRTEHVPLAYIRGKAEFYGREFTVNAHTLVPRPETETMIELLQTVRNREASLTTWDDGGRRRNARRRKLQQAASPQSSLVQQADGTYKVVWQKPPSRKADTTPPRQRSTPLNHHDEDLYIVDVGTGSGAIAITAKLELPEATVAALDIDTKCLEVARQNATKLGADVQFYEGNLLQPLQPIDSAKTLVLLCNLPYVPDNFQINTAATHEPHHALFGGEDGLDLYRELFRQAPTRTNRPAYILCESLPPQHESLKIIAQDAGYTLAKTEDFIQLFAR